MDRRQEKIVFLKKPQLLVKSKERRCVLSTKIGLKRAQQLQYKETDCAAVAQWIEYWPPKPRVVGSIPASRTNLNRSMSDTRLDISASSLLLAWAYFVQTRTSFFACAL